MRYTTSRQTGMHCLFGVQRPITSDCVDDLRTAWEEKLDLYQKLEIDISGVTRVDLLGLKLMIEIQREACKKEKRVEFVGFNPGITEALHVCRWFGELFISQAESRQTLVREARA